MEEEQGQYPQVQDQKLSIQNQTKKQKDFQLPSSIKVSSNFQSGNLRDCQFVSNNQLKLWIGSDPKSTYRTWFHFSIEGVPAGTFMSFTIMNMSNQVKLFKEGHLPVFKIGNNVHTDQQLQKPENKQWRKIKIPLQANAISKGENGYEVTFKHQFTQNKIHYFAFTYPWTLTQNDQFIQKLRLDLKQTKKQDYLCQYIPLCKSSQQNNLMLLTLTLLTSQKKNIKTVSFDELQKEMNTNNKGNIQNSDNKQQNEQETKSSQDKQVFISKQKIGIFVSARVHPGQVASSHILNGLLKTLFSDSVKARTLLQHCIFYIVPIINPDGVKQGNFRADSRGKNLNRFYTNPDPLQQPEIYHIKKFLVPMIKSKHIDFCLDLHAHVNKQGTFIYGNCVPQLQGQTQVCLFPKIMEFNCEFFDYESCNFSQNNMCSKDKGDDLTKQGAARVAIFKQTGLTRCWTLECNYNSTKIVNMLPAFALQNKNSSVSHGIICEKVSPQTQNSLKLFEKADFQSIGVSIFQSIMDYYDMKDLSRIYGTKLKNTQALRTNTAVCALRLLPFRFNANIRKLLVNISSKIQLKQTLTRISNLVNNNKKNSFKKIVQIPTKENPVRNSSLANKLPVNKFKSNEKQLKFPASTSKTQAVTQKSIKRDFEKQANRMNYQINKPMNTKNYKIINAKASSQKKILPEKTKRESRKNEPKKISKTPVLQMKTNQNKVNQTNSMKQIKQKIQFAKQGSQKKIMGKRDKADVYKQIKQIKSQKPIQEIQQAKQKYLYKKILEQQ